MMYMYIFQHSIMKAFKFIEKWKEPYAHPYTHHLDSTIDFSWYDEYVNYKQMKSLDCFLVLNERRL